MIVESAFKPAWWMSNCHLQTMLPKMLRKQDPSHLICEDLVLPDGDFVELCWTRKPSKFETTPIVVVFHGLEGNKKSHYAAGMLDAIQKRGWIGVLMHFRSCGERPNLLARLYHSGDTDDAKFFIDKLANDYPNAPLSAVGYSLGGNMLCKLMGEEGLRCALRAGIIVSAPLDLGPSCDIISQGSSRIYQKYLLDKLKTNLTRKWHQLDLSGLVKVARDQIQNISGLRDFDNKVTAPMHGFDDANHYYSICSGKNFIPKIGNPALFLHANDDPFLANSVVPEPSIIPEAVTFEVSQYGGHCGFVSGSTFGKPIYWQEQRAIEFVGAQL